MPIYTYHCEHCGVQFDRRQHFDDRQLTRCPECGKNTLRKVYQPVGILFKGSGFYSTDHRSLSGQGAVKKSEDKSDKPKNKKDNGDSPSNETAGDD